MSEQELQKLIMLDAPKHDCLLFRNNSGAFKDLTGRVVRFGLGNTSKKVNDVMKSSDLIGVKCVTITPDMVGQSVGILTAIEVKEPGWDYKSTKRERAQLNFIQLMLSKGARAGFAQSMEDYVNILK